MTETKIKPVSFLILGAGWTSTFLIPQLRAEDISYAATSTTGREGTIEFKFDPDSEEATPFRVLPIAKTVLITFPLKGKGQSERLVDLYKRTHSSASPHFIQLGSTGIWTIPNQEQWLTRKSPYDETNPRAIAEDELLELGGCVLNLSGLWGGQRQPSAWAARVAKTKEELASKASLHLIHGRDVGRAIVAVSKDFTGGERWMLTDMFVYDWWSLIMGWANERVTPIAAVTRSTQVSWVQELMIESDVRALPRSMEQLGRCYDTREFWQTFKLVPLEGRAK